MKYEVPPQLPEAEASFFDRFAASPLYFFKRRVVSERSEDGGED